MIAAANRIAELEAALRPLADVCLTEFGDGTDANGSEPNEGSVFAGVPDGTGITFGMIRRAHEALTQR